jgi:MFS family permease
LATAFGVHRALDAFGALAGPLLAFAMLAVAPRSFDRVFVVSFSFALVGLAIITLFVENAVPSQWQNRAHQASAVVAPLSSAPFRRTLAIACVLALATVSDAFIYLLLQRRDRFGAQIFPLLAAGTAVSYVLLAVPAGHVADRIGRGAVFITGHVALLGAYAMLLQSLAGATATLFCVLLLGSYYAMTDGVLAAAASGALDQEIRGSGLAILGTAVSLSRLAASLLFGWAWTRLGPSDALLIFAVALAAGVVAAALSWRRLEGATP